MSERWKDIPGWPNYQASTFGRIRRVWKFVGPKILKPVPWKNKKYSKYTPLFVSLSSPSHYKKTGRWAKQFKIAKLILLTFRGPSKKGQIACHRNDDQTDNRLVNLRWQSRIQNDKDRKRNGGYVFG